VCAGYLVSELRITVRRIIVVAEIRDIESAEDPMPTFLAFNIYLRDNQLQLFLFVFCNNYPFFAWTDTLSML